MTKDKSSKAKKQTTKVKETSTKSTNQRKLTAKEKAAFSEMNQIEWFPVDPYND